MLAELTLPVAVALDYTTRNLKQTTGTEPVHDFFSPTSGTSDLMAFIAIEKMFIMVKGEVCTKMMRVEGILVVGIF